MSVRVASAASAVLSEFTSSARRSSASSRRFSERSSRRSENSNLSRRPSTVVASSGQRGHSAAVTFSAAVGVMVAIVGGGGGVEVFVENCVEDGLVLTVLHIVVEPSMRYAVPIRVHGRWAGCLSVLLCNRVPSTKSNPQIDQEKSFI